jgi:RHS repeat-associated protein
VEDTTGLVYLGARWYSPEIGRFYGVDPVHFREAEAKSVNRYAYANNNPYRYVDPDGQTPVDIVFLAADLWSFGKALYTGQGVGSAAVDVAISIAGVVAPVPGTGLAMKSSRVASLAKKGPEHAPIVVGENMSRVQDYARRV